MPIMACPNADGAAKTASGELPINNKKINNKMKIQLQIPQASAYFEDDAECKMHTEQPARQ